MEIEVGEYVRNKEGYIDIVEKVIEPDEYMPEIYYCCKSIMASSYKSEIIKHSKDIKDLIEIRDYVNGYKVISVDYNVIDDKTECIELDLNNNYQYNFISARQIKTILTHEQFEANCYKVGGKDE